MSGKLLFSIFSLCMFLHAEELLRNGSFEKTYGLEEVAAFWISDYVRTKETAYEGEYSAKVIRTGNDYSEAHSIEIAVKAGTPFELSGYYKGPTAYIYTRFTRSEGEAVSLEKVCEASPGKWSRFVLSGTVPEKATKCHVLLRTWDKETPIFFDSVHLDGVSPVEPVKPVTTAAGISLEVPADATPTLLSARSELENYLPKVVKGSVTIDGRKLSRIAIGIDGALDGEEAWSIKSEGDTLRLAGGGPRGAIYAVYVFLEEYIGIHWWTPWEEHVPAAKEWKIAKISRTGKPFFFYRDIYRNGGNLRDGTAQFAVRNRTNRSGDIPIPAELGGSRTFGPPYFVHSFALYVRGKVAEEHPEFLSLVDGERVGNKDIGQLCMTNVELRDYVAETMMKHIAYSWSVADATGNSRPLYFDISPNDNHRFCECENCRKMEQETSLTDLLIDFTNHIAAKVGEKYPEVFVRTSAYLNTTHPPKKIFPRHNVIIDLANIPAIYNPDITTPEFKEYRELVEGWAKVSRNMMCWDYCLAHWPFTNDLHIHELMDLYRRNNFTSIFMEMTGQDYLLDCFDMKTWLYAKMMENPAADFEALRQTFRKGYYGPAAPFVDAFRRLADKAQKRGDTVIKNRHRPNGFDFYNIDELIAAHKLFDDAEKVVAGDILLETRLMRVRASLNLLTGFRIARYMDDWKKKGATADDFPIDRTKLAANMRRLWLNDNARYQDSKMTSQKMIKEGQISIMENLGTEQHEVQEPPEFKGHTVVHFCPSTLTLHTNPNMSLIKDPDAREGCAFQVLCTPRDEYFGMPFEAGSYNAASDKTTLLKKWDTLPKERGFQWLHMGKDHLHMKYYVYLTGSWEIQASMEQYLEFGDKDLDIWIRIKFEGPKFYPEDVGKTNRIVVDSISFVEL